MDNDSSNLLDKAAKKDKEQPFIYLPKDDDITVFAETNFRAQKRKFGIKRDDRRRHMYLLGKTGVGKSTMMENMLYADIMHGEGVALVDPHGDFAEKMLNYIPSWRINDVVYFNPADTAYPVAFNALEKVDEAQKHLIASGVVGVFKKMFADSWGPRLEYLLRNAILALLDYPGSTLLGIMRILVDKTYRAKVLSKVSDPVVRSFWLNEYAKYPDRFQVEAVAPIQNKVGQFLSNFLIRNIVGQVKSTIDMREIMDKRKILIMNLAKGRIGEDTSSSLGALLITKIQLAAMERVDIPEKDRKDFYLYVDEFQNFATDSFATILSEARKYRLNLVIGHQYVDQLDERVASAVFGNVGTMVCFRVGPADAEKLVTEFTPTFTEEDLVNLKKYDIYLRLMIDGVASDPFSATGLPPLSKEQRSNNLEKIIKVSREHYATPREVIEEKISRWSNMEEETEPVKKTLEKFDKDKSKKNLPEKTAATAPAVESAFMQKVKTQVLPSQSVKENKSLSSDDKTPRQVFKAVCNNCGQETEVSFQPDGVRPVYCKDCLKKIKAEKMHKAASSVAPDLKLSEAVKQPVNTFHKTAPVVPTEVWPQKTDKAKNNQSKPIPSPAGANYGQGKDIKPGQVVKFDK